MRIEEHLQSIVSDPQDRLLDAIKLTHRKPAKLTELFKIEAGWLADPLCVCDCSHSEQDKQSSHKSLWEVDAWIHGGQLKSSDGYAACHKHGGRCYGDWHSTFRHPGPNEYDS